MGSMLMLILITVIIGFAGWLLFLWAVKSGQFDDIEGPKYRMMDEDEEKNQKKVTGKDNPEK